MKKSIATVCAGAALCFMASCGTPPAEKPYNAGINIIPAPQSLVQNDGRFVLNAQTTVYASTSEGRTVAEFFIAKINAVTGYALRKADEEAAKGISLLIDNSLDVTDEGYTLDVTDECVTVKAQTPQGLFYGMQTFLQLLPAEIESPTVAGGIAWEAPAVTVRDEPRFEYRGIMLDACRHFISVENIKKQLDVLSLFKINRLHWHLTDDQGWRIEIKRYPELTNVGSKRIEGEGHEYGGFYTQEDIKEVVQYAADRFITVIPEIEVPGHELAAIAAYPELSCEGKEITPRIVWGVEDVVMCAGKEEFFQFLEEVIDEVVPLFPGEYFHLGGDECPKASWAHCPLCQKRIREEHLQAKDGHSAEERLQSYFVQRVEKMLAKHGKKMIGWDEILEGGLAPTATVMSWRGEAGGIAAANMSHDVIMTPQTDGMYLDRFEGDPKIEPVTIGGYKLMEDIYDYNPTPDTLVQTGKANYIKGVQGNAWSEYMYTNDLMEYRIYPRILALSEIAWTHLDKKDYKDFERRIDNALVRLDGHNINYHIPQPEQPHGSSDFVAFTDSTSLAFKTTRPVKMVYTLDGSEPTAASTVYASPIEFTESGVLKIRSVLLSGKMSQIRTITVEKQSLIPAKEVSSTTPGLKLDVTYGYFLNTSEIPETAEWNTSVTASLRDLTRVEKSNESMRNVNQYAAVATGYIDIPEDGIYFFSSDNEEVWIDGNLLISNKGETKRFSRRDRSVALSKGLHEIKAVFLGHILGGWPSNWNNGSISFRPADVETFTPVTPEMLSH
ncbi:Beta-hexosaminidase [Bacteroidales bacterium Barb7]|nr:Beta-hexosaminidase [Bacteroidales bacterium Barb7]